jgi:hypothetical protein
MGARTFEERYFGISEWEIGDARQRKSDREVVEGESALPGGKCRK